MQRLSFHSARNADTNCWCDCITILYLFYITLNEIINLRRDEMFSKFLTNEHTNGEGRHNFPLFKEAFAEMIGCMIRGKINKLRSKKNQKMFDETNADRILQGHRKNTREANKKKEQKIAKFMEQLRITEHGREDIVAVEGQLVCMIRAEFQKTVWMAKEQENHTFGMIQGMLLHIHIYCLVKIVWVAKVHRDRFVMVKRTFVYIRSECLMTAWQTNMQRGEIHSKLVIKTHTEIKTTTLKTKLNEENYDKVHRRHNEMKGAQFNGERRHFYKTPPQKYLAIPRSDIIPCQNQKQVEREPEMDVQEESIKNDKIQTFCTEKNADKLNHMSEVTWNTMDKRGLLESYQNENRENGEFGKHNKKSPNNHLSKETINRKKKGVISRLKTNKSDGMLLQNFSLGKSILTKQKVVLVIFFCLICPVTGLNRACSASIATMKLVNECPKSPEDAHKRSCEMNCYEKPQNCTSPDKFKYHCLKHAQKDVYVEVCAPVTLISCHCAIYDPIAGMPQIDIENRYQGTLENCTYHSDMYPDKGCPEIFTTFNSTEKSINISMPCPEKKHKTFAVSTEDNNNVLIAAAVVGPIAVVVVGIITVFLIRNLLSRNTARRRRRFNGPENLNNQRIQFANLLGLVEEQ